MDIQRLRYFLEVARCKNFTRAAENCFISQPSLSQQIKKLEEEVGSALFERGRNRVVLTGMGDAFLRHAEAIMAEVATAEAFVLETKEVVERTLRFGAIPTIAPYLVPEIFQIVQAKHPKIRFELIENETAAVIEALRMGSIDFALLSPPFDIEQTHSSLLLRKDQLLLTLRKDHPLASADKLDAQSLKNERILLLGDTHCLSHQTSALCEEVGIYADTKIKGSQIDTLLGLIESGFGLSFIPETAARLNEHRTLCFRPMQPKPFFRDLCLVWLPRKVMPKLASSVVDTLRQHFQSSD